MLRYFKDAKPKRLTRNEKIDMLHVKNGYPFSKIVMRNILDVAQRAAVAFKEDASVSLEEKANELTKAMVNAVLSGAHRVLTWLVRCCSSEQGTFVLGDAVNVLIQRHQQRTIEQIQAEVEWCYNEFLSAQDPNQRSCFLLMLSYHSLERTTDGHVVGYHV